MRQGKKPYNLKKASVTAQAVLNKRGNWFLGSMGVKLWPRRPNLALQCNYMYNTTSLQELACHYYTALVLLILQIPESLMVFWCVNQPWTVIEVYYYGFTGLLFFKLLVSGNRS